MSAAEQYRAQIERANTVSQSEIHAKLEATFARIRALHAKPVEPVVVPAAAQPKGLGGPTLCITLATMIAEGELQRYLRAVDNSVPHVVASSDARSFPSGVVFKPTAPRVRINLLGAR